MEQDELNELTIKVMMDLAGKIRAGEVMVDEVHMYGTEFTVILDEGVNIDERK